MLSMAYRMPGQGSPAGRQGSLRTVPLPLPDPRPGAWAVAPSQGPEAACVLGSNTTMLVSTKRYPGRAATDVCSPVKRVLDEEPRLELRDGGAEIADRYGAPTGLGDGDHA